MASRTGAVARTQTPAAEQPAGPTRAPWSRESAEELYRVQAWGDSFFFINEAGHVAVQASPPPDVAIDIHDIVQDLRERKVTFPVLIRFQDVLKARVKRLNEAFRDAIGEFGYQNRYQGVYPIKVNQLHEVVEEVLDAGLPYGMGLECGSKAELVAAMAHLDSDDTPLLCNGYKDPVMLRLILAGQRLGKNIIPVMEKYNEFVTLLELAREARVQPRFGVRVRLGTGGAGKWAESGGDKSKFGISIPELVTIIEKLKEAELEDSLVLLHFHLGSQIADIQTLKQAVKEITQVYAQLCKRDVPIGYIDVGGGLGVNYEAGYAEEDGTINYTLQEYANSVVYAVKEVCDREEVPHPILISESGRAITAHHSVLVVEALGAYRKDDISSQFKPSRRKDHAVVRELWETLRAVQALANPEADDFLSRLLESYHDAVEKRQQAEMLFSLGYLPLEQKALAERLYWSACRAIQSQVEHVDTERVPPELRALDDHLVNQYLCDFSVFQSILDHWAIGQGFPIMPIHRLGEEPTERGLLVDLTCDSDGKVSHYVSSDTNRSYMKLHALHCGEPYYLGFFLMGAYQDIMGDAHNLFGRVVEAHVYADADEPGGYYIEKIIKGTTVQEMLAQVQYFPNDLHRRMNALIRQKTEAGAIRPKAGVQLLEQYMECFSETTYYRPDHF